MLLGSTKADVDKLLGRPVMARSVFGMTQRGEKTYGYPQPADNIIVGFFDDVARYMAVVRNKGPHTAFSPAEISSLLVLNAPPENWKRETADQRPAPKTAKATKKAISPAPPSFYYSSVQKDKTRTIDILGWQPGASPFFLFFLPAWPGQPPLILSEWQVEKALG